MLELNAQGVKDDRFLWRSPLLCPEGNSRIVYDFEEAGYDPEASWMVRKCAVLSFRLATSASKS
jgi:hypothetical protein